MKHTSGVNFPFVFWRLVGVEWGEWCLTKQEVKIECKEQKKWKTGKSGVFDVYSQVS